MDTRRTAMALFAAGVGTLPLLVMFTGPTLAGEGRFRLRELYPQERIEQVLVSRDRWRPWPRCSERRAWESLPEEVRKDLIAGGQEYLSYQWPSLPATLFLEFARNGNRSRYEREHFARRSALTALVIAECVEDQGRFLDDIANGVWALCEESFWGVPAHIGAQKAGSGLPDCEEPIVDLFAAESSESLAWTSYLVGEQLDKVSPLIRRRIASEIDRRILTPCLERDDFGWMGFRGGRVNNWNPWCNSNWLVSALLIEPNEPRRVAAVAKIVRSLDCFLDAYEDDGGCDEGPGYWSRAGASLYDCLDLLHSASGGAIDVYEKPLIQQIGRYIYRVHIADRYFVNFADASARGGIPESLVYRYGKSIGDDKMMGFAAHFFGESGGMAQAFEDKPGYGIGRYLAAIFGAAELDGAEAKLPLVRDVWMDGIQVMAARDREGSTEGLYVAAKGGHNAESHNHNDVGNFIVYIDGKPVIIDIGVETYSRKTFSAQRYEIWTMQSAYHSLPTIDGVMQSPGRQFAARNLGYRSDDAMAQLTLDIAGAYPEQAHLKSWARTITLNRGRDVTVTEAYTLTEPVGQITLSLMTPCRAEARRPGQIVLATSNDDESAQVLYDPTQLAATIEVIDVEDGRLRTVWPEKIARIVMKADKPPLKDTWTLKIGPAKP
ncbi:MAG: heparinase II/III family protein [Sedimentisphaerales bacterium]|nr:heparinase II/III family protein [Sedimentisphaerales bacterium]HNY78781.1 heparinase II/III family protein [Sedimentisphaerales bacterium]HOC63966.1 heparinase II/III family protein [Sedimentisphaerales bacterium]HOH62904.1 heparinase II/III family protein [Sedimentisphaerales bacterium]HPY50687.1 heparinase II/III family protein [Sedimentisphaerales bacterium]